MKQLYSVKKIYENTYQIIDKGLGGGSVNMYLLVGNEKAMLIDSGYGGLDLKKIVGQITDKPVFCACTHGHVDHAMGAYQFEESYMHSLDVPVFQVHSTPQWFGYMTKALTASAKQFARNTAEKKRTVPQPLDSIEAFELGDRTVTWMFLKGHTQGSVVFYDEKYNVLFDGDAAPPGVWLFLPESSTLREYRKNLEAYIDFVKKHGNPVRYGGHMKKALTTADLEKQLTCVDIAISGKKRSMRHRFPFADAQIMIYKSGAVFYNKDTI